MLSTHKYNVPYITFSTFEQARPIGDLLELYKSKQNIRDEWNLPVAVAKKCTIANATQKLHMYKYKFFGSRFACFLEKIDPLYSESKAVADV
jgi:hypothetical protein